MGPALLPSSTGSAPAFSSTPDRVGRDGALALAFERRGGGTGPPPPRLPSSPPAPAPPPPPPPRRSGDQHPARGRRPGLRFEQLVAPQLEDGVNGVVVEGQFGREPGDSV